MKTDTPSQERPEPPEGYRHIGRVELDKQLPQDAICWSPFSNRKWIPSTQRGRFICDADKDELFYATRTPLPSGETGGEKCAKCHGKGHGEDEQCDCIFVDPPEAPSPSPLDKDEIARLKEAFEKDVNQGFINALTPDRGYDDFPTDNVQTLFAQKDAELTTLRAQLTEARNAVQWQPIETAPKDGTKVLVRFADGESCVAAWWDCGDFSKWRIAHVSGYEWEAITDELQPTHWMPLPAMPTEETR